MNKIVERQSVDFDSFHDELVSASQPVVIRSLVNDWPAVDQCAASPTATCEYLGQYASSDPVHTLAAPPDAEGRFFYNDDLSSVNFKHGQFPLRQVLAELLSSADDATAHSIAELDDAQRRAWRDYFEYFVFRSGENPAAHLPANLKDIVTSLNPDQAIKARSILSRRLKWDD